MDSLPKIMQKYNVAVPGSLMMVLKVIWIIFAVAVKLDPGFNFNQRVKPYLDEIVEQVPLTRYAEKTPALVHGNGRGCHEPPEGD